MIEAMGAGCAADGPPARRGPGEGKVVVEGTMTFALGPR